MVRKAIAAGMAAVALVLITPAAWLLVYRAADLPLPAGELPELVVAPARNAALTEAARDSARNVSYLLERSLVRTAFELIPADKLPDPGSSDSEWNAEVWPPAWALGDSALAGHARLIALRTDRECADGTGCRTVRTLFARLVVLAAGGASAEFSLEWQARPDSSQRGWARMMIRRSGESWRLARFELLPPHAQDTVSDDILSRLYPLEPGYEDPRK